MGFYAGVDDLAFWSVYTEYAGLCESAGIAKAARVSRSSELNVTPL